MAIGDPGEPPVGEIGPGVVLLVGVGRDDEEPDARYIAEKTLNLRIFPDQEGRMNLSLLDAGLEALIISQFTLHGDVRRGRRPSFTAAATGAHAREMYEQVAGRMAQSGAPVRTGVFGGDMKISMIADGPVTILLDSRRVF